MNLLKRIIRQRYGILAITSVCIFSFTFSGISIYSAHMQNKDLQTLIKHPLKVSAAIHTVRSNIFRMQVRMERLVSYNGPADVAIVREKIQGLSQSIAEDLDYIDRYYLGPHEQAQAVSALLGQIYQAQENVLRHAVNNSITEISTRINTEILPLYQDVDTIFTEQMLTFIAGTEKRLFTQSGTTLNRNIIFSILISCFMIAAAFFAQRIAYARMKEKEYREYILKVISENAGTVFMLYDLRHRNMEYISPNIAHMVGIDKDFLEKNPERLNDYCESADVGCFSMVFENDVLSAPVSEECLFKNPHTGEKRWMLMNIYPVREENIVSRYIISIADLTEVKKTQQVLNDALVNAQNANTAKSLFFARMSHDIRTPMNAIIGMTTIAAANMHDTTRIEHCLTKIAASSRHLLLLINDVLDMSKIESGKMTIAKVPFNFADFITGLTSIIYSQARAKNLQFDISMNDITHEILLGDPLRLNQILLNILGNAIKFTPEGGSIHMHIQERPDTNNHLWLNFTIADTGIGMTQDFLERIYIPFEQELSDLSTLTPSTGLGMAITKNIVTLMHGTISAESTLGKGTTFNVGISFDIDPSRALPQPIELDRLKVLVVDDDKDTCEHTALLLGRIGIQAEWVLCGNEAVRRIIDAHDRAEDYNVVFVDWKMPEVDGLEVTRRIRKRVGPDTLIIIISAYDWAEIENEAREAGANAFISKPIFQSSIYSTLLAATKGTVMATSPENIHPHFNGKRFLLVEDNEINAEIAGEFLKVTGALIDTVDNGAQAVAIFTASEPGTYDIILMDIQMPVMDGYQATRAIRQLSHPDAQTIPIVAMTANAFDDDVSAALQSGMNDHLSKPIDIQLLYRKIHAWLHPTAL